MIYSIYFYFSYLYKCLHKVCNCAKSIIFGDDTIIFSNGIYLKQMQTNINEELLYIIYISKHLKVHKLYLNVKKMHCMIFIPKQHSNSHTRVPTKKVPWFYHDFSRPKFTFSNKKIPIFVFAAHVPICRINYRQTQTHTHTQTHTWFDQGQSTIQLILLVIELIQEVKTTLVNLIKMGNRFSYQHLKNDIDFSFPYRPYI